MSKEKQIEEMTRDLCRNGSCTVEEWAECSLHRTDGFCAKCNSLAEHLYNAGYRKQSEGEWLHSEKHCAYICSECEECAPVDDFREQKLTKFCPNCGAKMKGGAE